MTIRYHGATMADARTTAFIDMAAKERAGIKWTRIYADYRDDSAVVSVTYREGVQP